MAFSVLHMIQRQETEEQISLGVEQTLPSRSALSWLTWLYLKAPRSSPA